MKTETHDDVEYAINVSEKNAPVCHTLCKFIADRLVDSRPKNWKWNESGEYEYQGSLESLVSQIFWLGREHLRDHAGKQALTGFSKVRVRTSLLDPVPTEEGNQEIKERGATA